MKNILFIIYLSTIIGCQKQVEPNSSKYENFSLTYLYAGLGSGYNSMQPVFKVNETNYLYTLEENSSFTGEFTKEPKTICSGKIRTSSIDSIIQLTENIEDTLIYNNNPGIMSGGIHSVHISNNNDNLTFKLHNASDSIAEEVVAILNSNIPKDKKKLWLFQFDAPTITIDSLPCNQK